MSVSGSNPCCELGEGSRASTRCDTLVPLRLLKLCFPFATRRRSAPTHPQSLSDSTPDCEGKIMCLQCKRKVRPGHMRATFHFVSRKPTQEYLLTLSPLHAHNLKNHSAARVDVPQSRSKSLLLCSLRTALGVNGCPCQRCITCACLKNDPPTGLFPLANGFGHSPGLKFSTCPFRKLLVIWGCNYVFENMCFLVVMPLTTQVQPRNARVGPNRSMSAFVTYILLS